MTLFCAAICLAGTFTGHSGHLDTGALLLVFCFGISSTEYSFRMDQATNERMKKPILFLKLFFFISLSVLMYFLFLSNKSNLVQMRADELGWPVLCMVFVLCIVYSICIVLCV